LHLRNICLIDGVPTLFDGVEFNDEISCVDVLYDLAFLLMDLWRRQLPSHANAVFNRYVMKSGDVAGLPLLPFFLSCRAAIRAKTSATAATLSTAPQAADDLRLATTEYLTLADAMLQPPPPQLIAIGGFSGSGKSVLARALAPSLGAAPGAIVLQSDAIRKERLGTASLERPPRDAYTPEARTSVYRIMAERAGAILAAGHSAIADATYADPLQRAAIVAVARESGVAFSGLWLEAPADVLSKRVVSRAGTDVSDATVAVLEAQLATDLGPLDWQHVDASNDQRAVAAAARKLITGSL
jgi:predicted kinase